jgi:rSAM/selenodomain-associated transferase 1
VTQAAIGVMCKPPRAGESKTRLARDTGAEPAALLSAAFIQDVAAAVIAAAEVAPAAPVCVHWPPDCAPELRPLMPPSFTFLPQRDGDLGRKMHLAIADLLALGYDAAILTGADLPSLPPGILAGAAHILTQHAADVVIGPALDGGYYLIGARAPHAQLFEGIPWSTPQVFSLTMERAAALGLKVHLLPPWYDVDNTSSLEALIRHLFRPALPASGMLQRISLPPGPAVATRRVLETTAALREFASRACEAPPG